ncbi:MULTISPECIES: hypothetical protein [Cyanophyceae]|uniref:hypothetical protein n=1 Tax=Cyanophyceae TaxID=3028117 RepID=UPI0016845B1F|nr:hypothetical protein [Trichocoleus sp. FACHB-69]MBD1930744.1 hypothetical protein [Trichocoleus sp. FACHB-69]
MLSGYVLENAIAIANTERFPNLFRFPSPIQPPCFGIINLWELKANPIDKVLSY